MSHLAVQAALRVAKDLAVKPAFRKVVDTVAPTLVSRAVEKSTGNATAGEVAGAATRACPAIVVEVAALGVAAIIATPASVVLAPLTIGAILYFVGKAIIASK